MAQAEAVTTVGSSLAGPRTTWDTGPILSLGHDEVVLLEVLARAPGLRAPEAVHVELRGIAWPSADTGDKPREQARRVLALSGLLAPAYVLSRAQQADADAIRDRIIQICGPGGHRGESAAIVHARDDFLVFVVNDKTARDLAQDAEVGTACVADLLGELIELDVIDVEDAVDLCRELEKFRMHPGRRVTGRADLYIQGDGPLLMTQDEWDRL